MKKVIIVQFSIQGSEIETFFSLSKTMLIKSNAEEGCITYKLLKDLEKENEFFIYEEYESKEALEMHNSSEHYNKFLNAVVPLLAKKPIIESY